MHRNRSFPHNSAAFAIYANLIPEWEVACCANLGSPYHHRGGPARRRDAGAQRPQPRRPKAPAPAQRLRRSLIQSSPKASTSSPQGEIAQPMSEGRSPKRAKLIFHKLCLLFQDFRLNLRKTDFSATKVDFPLESNFCQTLLGSYPCSP